ncbi:MAG: OB-fold domain-containing protein [Chloroflexota bacterium]
MTTTPPGYVVPAPNADTREFWEGCKAHQFRVQRCQNCGTFRHYPRPACHQCASFDTEWVDIGGGGVVYSFTIARHPFHPAFRDKTPYAILVVEMDDAPGVRMASNMVDCPVDDVRIGMPVEVVWEDLSDEVTLYKFRPLNR